MARIRSVHPSLWTDAAFVSLSPMARLLLIGLWGESDDKGCFVWSAIEIKMRILPADNVDTEELLSELESAGRVLRYEVDGKFYGAVRNFAKFQRPKSPNDVHPMPSEIRKFAGHKSGHSPNGSPKPSQMEDGGDKMEETNPLSPFGIECPDWMPMEAFTGFVEMRQGMPKKDHLTERAVRLLIGKLDKFRLAGHDIEEVLNTSVENNWKGVFEPKGSRPIAKGSGWLDD